MSAQAMAPIEQLLPDFVALPGGSFLMGTPVAELSALAKRYGGTRESYREESPQHRVVVASFAIARTPTTHALYGAYVAATGARAPLLWHGTTPPGQLRDHPVVDISWEEANAFCAWLAEQRAASGTQHAQRAGHFAFRLPTEAEWEYAARGADGRSFPWGEEFATRLANTREGAVGGTTPVGAYPDGASPHGVYDMAGNVWEWTASLDALYPYQSGDGREGAGPGRRIIRGGCYANPHGYARSACRFRLGPGLRNEFTGFRLAVSLAAQGSAS